MEHHNVGILHPGQMGVFVAACIQRNGHTVYWVSDGRSTATRQRAKEHNLQDAHSVTQLCHVCDVIVSVCPPHAAAEVAQQVREHGFRGVYVDANAIAPQRAVHIAQRMQQAGIDFVDGGIVGGPAWESGETWLYLSGAQAGAIASLLGQGPLVARHLSDEVGRASALKACYAAYTKGTTALLCAILAAAEELGVRHPLEAQWAQDWPGFDENARERVRKVTAKAWRFQGEMAEIAATFDSVGLPDGFHRAAAQLYGRLSHFKDRPSKPQLLEVLQAAARGE